MAIETLFLDAGGVLVHPSWPRVAETLTRHGVPVEAATLVAADLRTKHRLDRADNTRAPSDDARVAQYFGGVLEQAGIARGERTDAALAELRSYHAENNLWEWVPEDVRPALGRLCALRLRLVMVSNANGTLHAHMERLGIAPYFALMVDSQLEGIEKPDPLIFRRALERSGAAPESTVHVGDLYHVDVAGARTAGLGAWLFDPGDLYVEADCPRLRSLDELVDRLAAA
jgi:HAD superfamily hydrolase (TIGR01549 family)